LGKKTWTLTYWGLDPSNEMLRETLLSLGNGFFCSRGTHMEAIGDGEKHYPGTYVAGLYNRGVSRVEDHDVENEDLVNLPNWLLLRFRTLNDQGEADCDWMSVETCNVLHHRQVLDLRNGVLHRFVRFRDCKGRITRIVAQRFVSMDSQHLAGMRVTAVPENWDGTLEIQAAVDGTVVNEGVKRYRGLFNKHLAFVDACQSPNDPAIAVLRVRTVQSEVLVAVGQRVRAYQNGAMLDFSHSLFDCSEEGFMSQTFSVSVSRMIPLTVEKIAALYTARDHALSDTKTATLAALERADAYHDLCRAHASTWKHFWDDLYVRMTMVHDEMEHRMPPNLILTLHLFHMLQSVSPHTVDMDAGMPARGWVGEAYRGHVFWDIIYCIPVYLFQKPELVRALFKYWIRRLPEAKHRAACEGLRGALFPWQSGATGREESQLIHKNPLSGRWVPDESFRQRHVNIAIAYCVWKYFEITQDMEFMSRGGGGVLFLQIMLMLSSLATYNSDSGRYEIKGVMGPDEFHENYPNPKPGQHGLDNNAYTNFMTAWLLEKALSLLDMLPSDRAQCFRDHLLIDAHELQRWHDISRKITLPFHHSPPEEGGYSILSQFEGYGDLKEFDWVGYKTKYGHIERLDRILEKESDSANRYKVSKQADTLMIFFLVSSSEVERMFGQLGYSEYYDSKFILHNVEYYLKRASHGSTLSRLVHSWVLARSDRASSWRLFKDVLRSDVEDIQGGTTAEGIHLGAMAGCVDMVQRCYTGMEAEGGVLWFHPGLPRQVECLDVKVRYVHQVLRVFVKSDRILRITAETYHVPPVKVGVRGDPKGVRELNGGETAEWDLSITTKAHARAFGAVRAAVRMMTAAHRRRSQISELGVRHN
jgi:alpha,alpha-trehalase